MKKDKLRKILINAIMEHAHDEIDESELIEIAQETNESLAKRVVKILNFYAQEQ